MAQATEDHTPDGGLERLVRPFLQRPQRIRCSSRWTAGIEYHAEQLVEVPYRDRDRLLWKDDFERVYRERLPGLATVRSRTVPITADPSLKSAYFLLDKQEARHSSSEIDRCPAEHSP